MRPSPARSARSRPSVSAAPLVQPEISPGTSSGPVPLSGSLLLTSVREKPAAPEVASLTATRADTATSLWFGGQSLAGGTVQLDCRGGRSVFNVTVPDSS